MEVVEEDSELSSLPSPEEARQHLDKETLTEAGIDESYAERPDKLIHDDDKGIERKIEQLPQRINRLTEDVELLYEAGYLNIEHWESYWAELLDFQKPDEDEFVPSSDMYNSSAPQEEFGRELGKMALRLMTLSPKGVDHEDFAVGILRGFVSGFTYEMPLHLATGLNAELLDKLDKHVEQMEKVTEEGLGSVSLTLMKAISDEAMSHIEQHLQAEGYETSEDFVIDVQKAMRDEYYNGKYLSLGIAEEADSKGEFIIENHITRERVVEVIEKEDLHVKYRLREKVSSDLDELLSSSTREVTALDVIACVPEGGGEVGEVARRVSELTGLEKSRTVPAVAKIGRFLACVEDRQLGRWKGTEILSIKQEGELKNWSLEPTKYGEVIKANVDTSTVKSAKETHAKIANPWHLFISIPDNLREYVKEEVDL